MSEKTTRKRKHIYDDSSADMNDSDSLEDSDFIPQIICSEESSDSPDEFVLLKELKHSDRDSYDNLQTIRSHLKDTNINAIKVLKTPLKVDDKARLIQMLDVYTDMSLGMERLELMNKIKTLYRKSMREYAVYSKYTEEDIKKMDEEEQALDSYDTLYEIKRKILLLDTSTKNKSIIYNRFKQLEESNDNEESGKMMCWLDWAVNLPYNRTKEINIDNISITLLKFRQLLDSELFGMDKVKEQLLLFLNSKLRNPTMKKCSLGLVGCPGVGKTMIAMLLARFFQFPFEQISFGGVSSGDFIKGHSYTFIGSEPGIIVKKLRKMQYNNGIIFMDEYEKISNSDKDNITASLLHVTDPSQNFKFNDSYLGDIDIDLSNIWFIYSMNSLPQDKALRDRIFPIFVDGYTIAEKREIIRYYLLPKILTNINRGESDVLIDIQSMNILIKNTSNNEDKSGVRRLEQELINLCNKIDFMITNKDNLNDFHLSFKSRNIAYPVMINLGLLRSLMH